MKSTAPGVGLGTRDSLVAALLFATALLLVYLDTVQSMVSIWSRSDTFAHGYLILPISLWLIWSRRHYLAGIRSAPDPRVAVLLLPVTLGWLLAWLVDVLVVQQFALVTMLIIGAWSVLGTRLASVLAFPLLFLYFAVPVGEGLVAPMMDFTAVSTVWLIRASGIPVYQEGLYFTLPSGRWSVVEACSGVRYIIASVTVGTLFAYLTYRSWWRRGLFILVSAIVPVFANTLRAYLIVLLGHFSDMTIATGADHLVYGWVFFGLVIFVLFWLGSFFREDTPPPAPPRGDEQQRGSKAALAGTVLLALALASLGPLVGVRAGLADSSATDSAITLPPAPAGWQDLPARPWSWQPPARVEGLSEAFYERDGEQIGVVLQYVDGSGADGEVIGSSRYFSPYQSEWELVGYEKVAAQLPSGELAVDEGRIRGPGGEFVAWSWYLVGDLQTSNDYVAKFRQAAGRLGLLSAGEWRILLVTPAKQNHREARDLLEQFWAEHGQALSGALQSGGAGAG